MQKNKGHVAWLVVALLLVVIYGCSSSSESPQSGTLRVSLTDAAADGFDAVNVTVSKVRVHQSSSANENDDGWSEITLSPARKINLLNLTNGVLEDLGQTSLPAGHYTQLRLVLSANTGTTLSNSVVLSGTTTTAEIPLVTPSAVQSGIKLINEFDVAAGQRVDLVLDFDALKSIVLRGNGTYALKPVIRVVPTVLTGIEGFVATSLTGSNVLVSAVSGTVTHSTVPNAQTGEFFLAHLEAGSYDVVITADGRATAVITGVPVSSATSTALVTTVSTSAVPISLPTSTMQNMSGTVTLNPADSTVTAFLAAKQAITSGLTVTVKTQPVDGAYTMSLPAGAPLLGQYGSGSLPISFSEQTASAGKYTAEASAAGYQTQSASVDVSAGDVIQDFLLAP
ncbi:MAG TPA: DUF4382 domain-containing protein [Nitrospirota bacterium]|nr:DUF4382 domain-containing protein [Nitrospirota bacterium]